MSESDILTGCSILAQPPIRVVGFDHWVVLCLGPSALRWGMAHFQRLQASQDVIYLIMHRGSFPHRWDVNGMTNKSFLFQICKCLFRLDADTLQRGYKGSYCMSKCMNLLYMKQVICVDNHFWFTPCIYIWKKHIWVTGGGVYKHPISAWCKGSQAVWNSNCTCEAMLFTAFMVQYNSGL